MSMVLLDVAGRERVGIGWEGRWLQAPSSMGMGRSEGAEVCSLDG